MARRKILADMGYEFTVMGADIDEKRIRKDNAEELVVALAEAKADAIMSRLKTTDHLEENTHSTLLITADTIFLAISYLHLLVSRWLCTMELLEKSHQVRKKRVSSSKVCLYLRSAVPSSISAKQVILFLFYQYYCSCYYELQVILVVKPRL
uniref:Maf protein n=1 Tax=Solanum tuberosum TaxID=4113 RepID=M0ZVF0_SOLTU